MRGHESVRPKVIHQVLQRYTVSQRAGNELGVVNTSVMGEFGLPRPVLDLDRSRNVAMILVRHADGASEDAATGLIVGGGER